MKFATSFGIITFATLLATSFDLMNAAECTAEQLLTNEEIQAAITSAAECKKINFATSSQVEVCADAKCLDVIKKAVKKLEDCTISGVSMKDTLEVAIAGSKGSSSSTITTTSTPATSIPAASSAVDTTVTPTSSSSESFVKALFVIAVAASSIAVVYAMCM